MDSEPVRRPREPRSDRLSPAAQQADARRASRDASRSAEESTSWPGVSRPVYVGGLGFTFKWNMGWMHDMLDYMQQDPIYRRWHHNSVTFSVLCTPSRELHPAVSHDEVVHGKGSMLNKMPGDAWQKFANAARAVRLHVRASRQEAALHGRASSGSGASGTTTRASTGTCSTIRLHAQLRRFVADLNRTYQHGARAVRAGLRSRRLSVDRLQRQREQRLLVRAPRADRATTSSSSCSTSRRFRAQGYRIGVPDAGDYAELLNSDAPVYGGSNVGNRGARRHRAGRRARLRPVAGADGPAARLSVLEETQSETHDYELSTLKNLPQSSELKVERR